MATNAYRDRLSSKRGKYSGWLELRNWGRREEFSLVEKKNQPPMNSAEQQQYKEKYQIAIV